MRVLKQSFTSLFFQQKYFMKSKFGKELLRILIKDLVQISYMSKVAETFYGALFTFLWKQYRKLERLKVPVEKEAGNTIFLSFSIFSSVHFCVICCCSCCCFLLLFCFCFVLLFYFHFIFKPDYYGIIRLLNKKII